ncbi:MAG TPA: hypothetical protein VKB80_03165 [Kofleriaceae bacterium]|nr:hypothetical protein [Kofleriaceae bacterium]
MARPTAPDRVAQEVADRLERTATLAADAILQSLYAPRVADPTSEEYLAYWRPILLPGGAFSPAGRDQVVARVGAPEFRAIAQALARTIRKEQEEVA